MLFIICMINVLMAGLFAGFTENVVLPTALVLFLVFLWGRRQWGGLPRFYRDWAASGPGKHWDSKRVVLDLVRSWCGC